MMLSLFCLLTAFAADAPFVEGSLQDVFKRAADEEKLVFIDVYTDWCGPCKLLDKTTWKDEKVKEVLAGKVLSLKVNAEMGEGIQFAKKYRITGYPTLLVLNAEGKVLDRHIGYARPRQFLVWLEKNLD